MGELDSQKKRQEELEKKCKEDFDCAVGDLPALIDGFKMEADKSVTKAEVMLGMKEDGLVDESGESIEIEPEDRDGI